MAAADANRDGAVDISDSQYTLAWLFLGTERPKAPFPACAATDFIEDRLLDCDAPHVCP